MMIWMISIAFLDEPPSPIASPGMLLAFDETDYQADAGHPHHTDDLLDIVEPSKSYIAARSSWRRKVRDYMHKNGFELPNVKPVN